jgi:hypothetical protein
VISATVAVAVPSFPITTPAAKDAKCAALVRSLPAAKHRATAATTASPAPVASTTVVVAGMMCTGSSAEWVTVEAMKSGIPVIGARAAATAELISNHHTGLLYEPGNASDLADAMQTLIDDEALRLRLAEAARLWANATFTRTRFAQEFLAVVEEALS